MNKIQNRWVLWWITLLIFVDVLMGLLAAKFHPLLPSWATPFWWVMSLVLVNVLTIISLSCAYSHNDQNCAPSRIDRILTWFSKRPYLTLSLLLFVVFFALFHEGWLNHNKVQFTNDGGGFGFSRAAYDGAELGGSMWCDTWWLGQDMGLRTINISYFLMWIFYHPDQSVPAALWIGAMLLIGGFSWWHMELEQRERFRMRLQKLESVVAVAVVVYGITAWAILVKEWKWIP